MAKISSFEDLIIWQESMDISIELYDEFKECRDFALRDQILRASLSVPLNISEGFERSNNKEFANFLRYAKGSSGEVRTQIIFAQRVGLIEERKAEKLIVRLIRLSKQIQSLRNSIKSRLDKNGEK